MHGVRPLIPTRSCGPCRACCVVYDIDDKPVHKNAQVVCPHHTGDGCGIYETRPQTCRTFFCQWRYDPILAEEWRPDLSGVVVTTEPVESGASNGHAITLVVFGDHAVILDDGFAIYVATMLDRGYEALLRIPRGVGRVMPQAKLSLFTAEGLSTGNLGLVKEGIAQAYRALMAHPAPLASGQNGPHA